MLRDPIFSDLAAMQQRMNAVLGPLFGPFFATTTGNDNGRTRRWVPTVDVFETDEHYVVYVDLPGVDQDNVAVEFENGVLTITGERVAPSVGETLRFERPYGEFIRTLALPQGVDADQIQADYAGGVLELRIPKPAGLKPKRIPLAAGRKALSK